MSQIIQPFLQTQATPSKPDTAICGTSSTPVPCFPINNGGGNYNQEGCPPVDSANDLGNFPNPNYDGNTITANGTPLPPYANYENISTVRATNANRLATPKCVNAESISWCDYRWPTSIQPTNSRICVFASPISCPVVNGIEAVDAYFQEFPNRRNKEDINDGQIQLNCVYNISDFKTIEDYNKWVATNWGTPAFQQTARNNANQSIAPQICAQSATSVSSNYGQYCPTDSLTSQQMTDCSRFVLSNDPNGYGNFCRTWCDSNIGQCSTAMGSYCTTSANAGVNAAANGGTGVGTYDCRCVNGSLYQTYRALIETGSVANTDAKCWWIPCSTPNLNPYLVPISVSNQTCPAPAQVCQEVIQATNNVNTNINIGSSSGVIQCGAGISNANSKTIGIIIIIALIILVVIGIVLFFVLRK